MNTAKYLHDQEAELKIVNGKEIVSTSNFDVKKAVEYLNERLQGEEWTNELTNILSQMTFTYVEHPREADGCPGAYTKLKGTYKGQEFEVFMDYDRDCNDDEKGIYTNTSEELKVDIDKILWGGDWTTYLFWT